MQLPGYAELHCLSNFSFLRGASHPEELVRRALELEYTALAITDECSLAGIARAHAAARGTPLQLIIGSEFRLSDGFELVLLARDRDSYGALSKLITHARMESPKGGYRLTRGDLEAHAPCGCFVIWLPAESATVEDAAWLKALFGDRVWIGVELLLTGKDEDRLASCRRLAGRTGFPLTAAGDVHMHSRGRRALQDTLTAIRMKRPLHELGYALHPNGERHLRPRSILGKLYPPELLAGTLNISAQIHFSLDELRYEYPDEIVPAGHTPATWLRVLTEQGAKMRWPEGVPDHVRRLIEHELVLIADLGYEPYFLTVHDVVRFAREQGILCQGRGSAANSAVCFCLGITEVDPARMNMLMERFISRERNEPPDIDVDFEHERREEVIQYIYRKYGHRRAALAASVITYRLKSAVRDVGKALGLSLDQVDRLARQLQWWDRISNLDERLLAAGFDPENPKIRQLIILTTLLHGFPRHLSQHTGGFVIASKDLAALVPIENASMEERTVIQWDKDDLESLGLIKVDVLALGMLSAIRKTFQYIEDYSGKRLTLATVPAEDAATYEMIRRADTVGVFQIESRAQMSMLPRLKPRCFYDLVIEVAIVRPGPIQGDMVHPYLERRKNPDLVDYPSHALKKVLERTLGVPIFQEQAMQIAMVAANFSAGEADALRRAMAAWKKRGGLEPFEERLKEGMRKNGYDAEFAERVYHQLRGFGEYGFPECVVGETRVVNADTGRWLTVDEIMSGRACLENTLACDENLRLRKRRVLAISPSGVKPVWRLRTALGHTIVATAEHPFMTVDGWRHLGKLRVGDYVAAARSVPVPGHRRWLRHQILVLADLIAEGNLCHPSTFYFYTTASWHRDEFVKAVERFANTRAVVERHRSCFSVRVRRIDRDQPIGAVVWARARGIWGRNAREKHLPPEVFELCNSHIALLLARLWEGDGGLSMKGHASYDTASHRLGLEVQHLLLRLHIVARLYRRVRSYKERKLEHYVVTVTGQEPLRRFWRHIGRRFMDPDKRQQSKALATRGKGRMSRDIIPVEVRTIIRRERDALGLTWCEIGRATGLAMREIQARSSVCKKGFRRSVIDRLAAALHSHDLTRLSSSDVYWDEVVAIEALGQQPTYDLKIEGDQNFLANNLVVHNSHAASFALLTYVSSWLKCHEPAAFACGLLNSQPMGFYAPSQLVQDARRHGVEVRPVDIRYSRWDCYLEMGGVRANALTPLGETGVGACAPTPTGTTGKPALRLGLRLVKGLKQESANRIVAARGMKMFDCLQDLVERCALDRSDVSALAAADALQGFASSRYRAHWQAAGIEKELPVFPELRFNEAAPLLGRPGEMEEVIGDYNSTGLSLKHHPLSLLRERFDELGVYRAMDLSGVGANAPTPGRVVKVVGLVVCRQRPDTASGVMFVTLEDETGPINLIVWPKVVEAQRQALLHGQLILVHGSLQKEEGVIHVIVRRADDYSGWLSGIEVRSRNFAEGIRVGG